MRLHHGVRTLAAVLTVLTAAAFSASTAYGRYADETNPARTAAGPTTTASPLGRPNLDQTSTKAAANTASANATPTLTGKPYVPAPTMTGAPNAVAPTLTGRPYALGPTLTGRPYALGPTLTGKPYPGSPMLGADADHQNGGDATALHPSGGPSVLALIGLGVAAGIALIGAGAAGSRRPSRRTARLRAVSGS